MTALQKEEVEKRLVHWRVYVSKIKVQSKTTTSAMKAPKKTALIGRDCVTLFNKADKLIDLAVSAKNPNNARYKTLWRKLQHVAYLCTKAAGGRRREFGKAVRDLQTTFLSTLSAKACTLYLHVLSHAIKWAEELELWRASTQSLEHMNKLLKRYKGNCHKAGTLTKRRRDGLQGVTKKSREVQCPQSSWSYRMAKSKYTRRDEKRKERDLFATVADA